MTKAGDFTYGHDSIEVMSWGEDAELVIGRYCSISQNVRIFLGGNHRSDWTSTYPFGHVNQNVLGEVKFPGHPTTNGDVIIGHDVWIGFGVTIMSGVTIGSGAIIAANSHVVTNVSEYEIWGGNPAQLIKRRFEPDLIEKLLEISWWDYSVEKVLSIQTYLSSPLSMSSLLEIEKILKSA
jgi:acetyltransferase-like isoleucine patch superfamily enzyme